MTDSHDGFRDLSGIGDMFKSCITHMKVRLVPSFLEHTPNHACMIRAAVPGLAMPIRLCNCVVQVQNFGTTTVYPADYLNWFCGGPWAAVHRIVPFFISHSFVERILALLAISLSRAGWISSLGGICDSRNKVPKTL